MNQLEIDPEFEALLSYLKYSQGCDLTNYKRSTLLRRFKYRMNSIKIDSYQDYLQYLQYHPEEHIALLNDVLINFTSFFRDRDIWNYLAAEIIPKIIANKQPNEPIRVWSAGCAAGQEIYSLLILLAEALGVEFCLQHVQCYATDNDEVAVRQARKGTYTELEVRSIPPDLLKKYFEQTAQGYVFHPALRCKVVFGRHDLSKDAPMSKIDLLLCRNVFIYFKPETQISISIRFHYSLRSTGFLVLGKSEVLINRSPIFKPINLRQRVYAKGLNLECSDYLAINPKSPKKQEINLSILHSHFWQTAFAASPVAQIAVEKGGHMVGINEQANFLFGLTLNDWKRPLTELEPGRLIGSYASMKKFLCNRDPKILKNIKSNTSQGIKYFDISIVPVFNPQGQFLGMILTFLDETSHQQSIDKLEHTGFELARVTETLQSTESALSRTQIELEAVRQELQLTSQDKSFKN
ncbi:chemotaxis protein CheR [Phormidium tenue FACHB-886]|nr:chemotaxis protein CheR [Phormidium tenue FACHB-886]